MKSKYHLIKNKVYVQLTDGSVFKLNIFSKIIRLKLNLDPKSHILWKNIVENSANKNYRNSFMKKFFFKNN
jgi:hypothetical protein